MVRIAGVDLELVERVGRLAAGDIHVVSVRLAPGLAAVVAPIDFVPDPRHAAAASPLWLLIFVSRTRRLHVLAATTTTRGHLTPVDRCAHLGRSRIDVLDHRVEHIRILLIDVDADPAETADGQSAGELLPFHAAVVTAIEAGARPTEHELPRHPVLLVHRGVEDVG